MQPDAPETQKAPVSPSAPSLTPELWALERVHASLAGNRLADALEEINAYQNAFPNGALQQESEAMRLEALVRLGRRAEAETRARTFLTEHPQSPQAARIRALLDLDGRAPRDALQKLK